MRPRETLPHHQSSTADPLRGLHTPEPGQNMPKARSGEVGATAAASSTDPRLLY